MWPCFAAMLLCLEATAHAAANLDAVQRCIHGVITLPILDDRGGLAVPVEIDGKPVAALLSTRAIRSVVVDPTGLDLPHGPSVDLHTVTGRQGAYATRIDRLQLAGATVRDLPAFAEDPATRGTVGGRQLTLVIGYDILSAYEVLVDLPHRTVDLFLYGAGGCPDVAGIFGQRVDQTALHPNDAGEDIGVAATIDGHAADMQINLDANLSLVGRAYARGIGVADATLRDDPQIRTENGMVRLGHRHRFASLAVGGRTLCPVDLGVLPGATYNALGLDFFAGTTFLLDFAGRRLLVGHEDCPSGCTRRELPSTLSTAQTRDVHVRVLDSMSLAR